MRILKKLFSGIYDELASIDYPKLIVWSGLIAASVALWVFLTPLAILMTFIAVAWFFYETRNIPKKPRSKKGCENCTPCSCSSHKNRG